MSDTGRPTPRELDILGVLWERGEATVREVYEDLREHLPIVQNTVQAMLRTMEQKGQVDHRIEGRSFVYRACIPREEAGQTLLGSVLQRVFDGAIDHLVASALSLRQPTRDELDRLRELIEQREREMPDEGQP